MSNSVFAKEVCVGKIAYIDKDYQAQTAYIIDSANRIIADYQARGYRMTVRQLYYRFIALDWFPDTWREKLPNGKLGSKNNPKSYDKLVAIISDGRMTGDIDWDAIEDRTRSIEQNSAWNSPADILRACAKQYNIDMWRNQPYRPIVLVEKEALSGVIEPICRRLEVPFGACRGYMSLSMMHELALRLIGHIEEGQEPIVFHLGDHDPSGIDMSGDIDRRLETFIAHHLGTSAEVTRLALNFDQIQNFNPPPSPAKMKDSRATTYVSLYGYDCWELDALEPQVLDAVVTNAVLGVRDVSLWDEALEERTEARSRLSELADNWVN